jgi:hypothetical protein
MTAFSNEDKKISANYRNVLTMANGQDNPQLILYYPIYLKMLKRNGCSVNKYIMFLKKYINCISLEDEDNFDVYFQNFNALSSQLNEYKRFVETGDIVNIIIVQSSLKNSFTRICNQLIVRQGSINVSLYLENSVPAIDSQIFENDATIEEIGAGAPIPDMLQT